MYGTVLIHHGIKGQKWGVRRYQNKDGTLTEEGKKHYGINDSDYYDIAENRTEKAYISERKKRYKDIERAEAEDIKRLNTEAEDKRFWEGKPWTRKQDENGMFDGFEKRDMDYFNSELTKIKAGSIAARKEVDKILDSKYGRQPSSNLTINNISVNTGYDYIQSLLYRNMKAEETRKNQTNSDSLAVGFGFSKSKKVK